MLVEGPPGPEGPAVSGGFSTPCSEGCTRSLVWDAGGGLSAQLVLGPIASICHACVQSAPGLIFLVQKQTESSNSFPARCMNML